MRAVDDDFPTIVEDLDAKTKKAVKNQVDPDEMTDKERKNVRLAVLRQVYGKFCADTVLVLYSIFLLRQPHRITVHQTPPLLVPDPETLCGLIVIELLVK